MHLRRGGPERGPGEGAKPLIHFHCVLHEKNGGGGGGVQIECKNMYIISGRPLIISCNQCVLSHNENSPLSKPPIVGAVPMALSCQGLCQ